MSGRNKTSPVRSNWLVRFCEQLSLPYGWAYKLYLWAPSRSIATLPDQGHSINQTDQVCDGIFSSTRLYAGITARVDSL